MMKKDEAYEMLACKIVNRYTDDETRKILADFDFLNKIIVKEILDLDFDGVFLDAAINTLTTNRQRAGLEEATKPMASYIISLLDLDKLKAEVSKLL